MKVWLISGEREERERGWGWKGPATAQLAATTPNTSSSTAEHLLGESKSKY